MLALLSNSLCFAASNPVKQMPSGMLVYFDLASCPSGWSLYAAGAGRVLLGSGSGNTDSLGANLTSRTYGDSGGTENTPASIGFMVVTSAYQTDTTFEPGPTKKLSRLVQVTGTANIIPAFVRAIDLNPATLTTLGGTGTDSNMPPYVTLLLCRKN